MTDWAGYLVVLASGLALGAQLAALGRITEPGRPAPTRRLTVVFIAVMIWVGVMFYGARIVAFGLAGEVTDVENFLAGFSRWVVFSLGVVPGSVLTRAWLDARRSP